MADSADLSRNRTSGVNFAACHLLAILSLLVGAPSLARSDVGADSHPLKTANTSSPRATLTSFMEDFDEMYRRFYEEGRRRGTEPERRAVAARVMRCMDLSQIPESVRASVGAEAGVLLKETLDRIELPPVDSWPGAQEVADEELTGWTIPETEISIVRIEEGSRAGEFLFSAQTVARAPDFYEIVRDLPYQDRDAVTPGIYRYFRYEPGWLVSRTWIRALPSWARASWHDQTVWQWVLLIATLLIALGLMISIYLFGRWRARELRSNVVRYLITLAFPAAAMLVPLASITFISEHIRVSGTVLVVTVFVLRIVFLFSAIVVLLGAGTRLAALVIATPWIQKRGLDAQLVRLAFRVISIVAAVIVFLEGGRQFGIPLTTLVASAGVGGLALALAAQDTLKNVFGSVMITLDKPYQVGELVKARGYVGFVEEIGLRSTKLRMLNGHQATIPNEEMARSDVENIGRRPFVRREAVIEVPASTSVAKIERALEIVREEVENHEGRKDERPPRIVLRDINESSLGLYFTFWYHPPDYWESLAVGERIYLKVFERLEAERIRFAAPELTVYGAAGIDGDGRSRG